MPSLELVTRSQGLQSLSNKPFEHARCFKVLSDVQAARASKLHRNHRRRSSVVQSKRGSEDAWERWEELPVPGSPYYVLPQEEEEEVSAALPEEDFDWRKELRDLAQSQQPQQEGVGSPQPEVFEDVTNENWQERAFLVGASSVGTQRASGYTLTESLNELSRLASSAGLQVVGRIEQNLEFNSRTYVGSGKLLELQTALEAAEADTVIFDDELKPGQLRALDRALGSKIRLCDRTALILDIFSQRAASKEGQLQVELAQCEYQLPRLTRMWTHLERQAGGRVRGMGEKQLEVDKRLLRSRMSGLRKHLDDTRRHRRQSRDKRAEASIPVIALVGYTNAGKSTLLNRLTEANVMARDTLFATLDPTTRRLPLPSGREVLLSDTVGFIQKLPTQLVAAFRATLEEIAEASLLLHVVDLSHPNAAAQSQAVMQVLEELGADGLPLVTVWNKVDACAQPDMVWKLAANRPNTVALSAMTGEGIEELLETVEEQLSQQLTNVHALVPYSQGDLLDEVHRQGTVQHEAFSPTGTLVAASVPASLANRLRPLLLDASQFRANTADLMEQMS